MTEKEKLKKLEKKKAVSDKQEKQTDVSEKPAEETKPEEAPKEGETPEVPKAPEKEPKTTVDFIKLARERAKPRKFTQSWDLCINLKGMNLKKPENRFNLDFALPEGRGKDIKVALFADSLASRAKEANLVIKKSEIDGLAGDNKKLKKIVREHDWFFGEATLMVQIGKTLGAVLAPRGKMPRPIPPDIDPDPLMLAAKKNVRVQVKESPVLHIPIGSDRMDDQQIANNLDAVFNFVKEKLPRGGTNIKSVYVKLTMGPAIKVKMK